MDLHDLIAFIMFYFYAIVFGDSISRSGGYEQLIEFIHDHRYHNYEFPETTVSLDAPVTGFKNQTEKEILGEHVMVEEIDVEEAENDECSISMAQIILKSFPAISEVPNFPSYEDMVKSLVAYKKKERKLLEAAEKPAALNVHLDKCSNLITETKTNDSTKCQDNIEQYESIIQAVIRHNHSKSSGHENANTKIQEEANGVLQHLKETVKKLTNVLNEVDKD